MTGPLVDDVEQILCTQKMSDSCHTAVAQCIYTCSVDTVCLCVVEQCLISFCKVPASNCSCVDVPQHARPAFWLTPRTTNACVQNQKQQLKSWEQNSPSHMQMVQQQQPFSLQGDPDTKMPQITGFDHDRQQLATAMAGACHEDSCLMIPGL